MKSFTTGTSAPLAPGEEERVGAPVEIELDGRKVTFAAPPSKTFLILMTIWAEMDSGNQLLAMGNMVNMVFNLLEGEDRNHMRRRLFDKDDPMDEETVMGIVRHLIEEWSGRPTESPSGSDSPLSSSGASLTGTASPTASIPASFGQTDSSTSSTTG